MKKLVLLLALISFSFAIEPVDTTKAPVKVTEAMLTPYEKVLAGVLLMNESATMSSTKKHKNYLALLKESKITHQEFQANLKASKANPKEWQKILERLKSALE